MLICFTEEPRTGQGTHHPLFSLYPHPVISSWVAICLVRHDISFINLYWLLQITILSFLHFEITPGGFAPSPFLRWKWCLPACSSMDSLSFFFWRYKGRNLGASTWAEHILVHWIYVLEDPMMEKTRRGPMRCCWNPWSGDIFLLCLSVSFSPFFSLFILLSLFASHLLLNKIHAIHFSI